MISEEHARRVLDEALSLVDADEAQAVLRGGKLAVTRFAENALSQNSVKKDYVVSLLVVRDGRVGEASSNRFDTASLRRMVAGAQAMADAQVPDPQRAPLPGPAAFRPMHRPYDQAVMDLGPQEKARLLRTWIEDLDDEDLSGAWSTGDACLALANHRGLHAYAAHTKAHFSVTCRRSDRDASGWDEVFGRFLDDVDPERAVERARELAARDLPAGDHDGAPVTVILAPAAVRSLVGALGRCAFGAEAVDEGRSPLSGRMGTPVLSPLVTLVDDPWHGATPGIPFDFEGSPRQALRLVESGVPSAVVHDRQSARRLDGTSTGHAQPYGVAWGPLPVNLRLEAGESSMEEMVATTERGILVTRFWYDNMVDRRVPTMTGMSRDGTFLVEEGRLTKRLPNLRYNVDVLDVLRKVDAVGRSLTTFARPGSTGAAMAFPALRMKGFTFLHG